MVVGLFTNLNLVFWNLWNMQVFTLQENATFHKVNLTKVSTLTQGYVHFD
jgi:hypothetical protein